MYSFVSFPHGQKPPFSAAKGAATVTYCKNGEPKFITGWSHLNGKRRGLTSYTRTRVDATEGNSDSSHHKTQADVNN